MLANLLIGLREGLEATLVVSLLVAFLVKSGARHRLPAVAAGVAAAVVLSLGVGAALTLGSKSLTFEAQETFGGTMSIIAVGFVTWMVFWMRRAAAHLGSDMRARIGDATAAGALTVFVTAFLAVGREGIETALFVWTNVQAAGRTAAPVTGAVLGILIAVVLGWLLYRQAIRIDLRVFFTWTGAALIIVAAGVLAYGVHDLQEAGVLPGLGRLAFDVSAQVPPSSWYGTLLKGVFNFSPATTWLEAVVWVAYTVPVLTLFLRRRPAPAPRAAAAPHEAPAPVAGR